MMKKEKIQNKNNYRKINAKSDKATITVLNVVITGNLNTQNSNYDLNIVTIYGMCLTYLFLDTFRFSF